MRKKLTPMKGERRLTRIVPLGFEPHGVTQFVSKPEHFRLDARAVPRSYVTTTVELITRNTYGE